MDSSFINLKDFDYYLQNRGYQFIEFINFSRIVNIVKNNQGINTVLKRDKGYPEEKQTLVENEILERLSGLEGLPRKVLFIKGLKSKILNKFKLLEPGLKGYFLEQQFIEGDYWYRSQLSTSEEQRLINLVRTFHKSGYSNMDLRRPSNFILTSDEKLFYIDAGSCIKKNHPDFESFVEDDLRDLEVILKKSVSIGAF